MSNLVITAALILTACAAPSANPTPAGVEEEVEPTVAATPAAETPTAAPTPEDAGRPEGWRDESHSNDVDPNYEVVFPAGTVNQLTITIAPDDWAAMQADLEEIFADSLPIRQAILDAGPGLTTDERIQIMRQVLNAMPTPSAPAEPKTGWSPIWVPATISFQDQVWTHVGVRYKGETSLSGAWTMGEMRLPFKFDFDEFEDDYPEIKNQRFFGFKQLSLANNYEDPTNMRDILVYDLLQEAGLPSVRTAPYEIVLDYGNGPTNLGLYTLVEVVDDTGVPAYFGSNDGNIYEGNGRGAHLSTEHVDLIESSFEKKNNEDDSDWSDIRALYDALHSEKRASDPEAWRAELEAVFNVDTFLEWVGIRAIVGHADSYGATPHNFYLYNDPATGKLNWISWDHNLTFKSEYLTFTPLDKPGNPDSAPLIGFLLDDPVYFARYTELLAENFVGAAAPETVLARVNAYAELIAPYTAQQMTVAEYDAAVQAIIDFVTSRGDDIEGFLANQP